MKPTTLFFVCGVLAVGAAGNIQQVLAEAGEQPVVAADGTVHVPAFDMPLSRYMSELARRRFIEQARAAPPKDGGAFTSITKSRADVDEHFRPLVARARSIYSVEVKDQKLGGVATQIVTPTAGVPAENRNRVLLNLHGGGFTVGAGLEGLLESIPVSAMGRFKVITVDYREAPEYHFPAASEDVASVYRELLQHYRAENIGIYGCSAGGILSAMAAAWLQKTGLPTPGAIGIFGAGAFGDFEGSPANANTWGGDSRFTAPMLGQGAPPGAGSQPGELPPEMYYIGNTDPADPLVSPALSGAVLAKFPPTLLLTGTRAYDMSAAVQTQRELTKVGVEADLHVWDGMGHCFFYDVDLPESQEAYAVMTRFFRTHLRNASRHNP